MKNIKKYEKCLLKIYEKKPVKLNTVDIGPHTFINIFINNRYADKETQKEIKDLIKKLKKLEEKC